MKIVSFDRWQKILNSLPKDAVVLWDGKTNIFTIKGVQYKVKATIWSTSNIE